MQPDDPNLLVLKQRPLVVWLYCAIFAITGLVLLFSPGLLIPGLFCLGAGLGILLLASVDTLTLDKNRNRFSLQRRYVWRTTLKECRLDELSGFELERNRDRDGGSTYRIIAVLASGQSIPLTAVYTSGREGKRRRVEMLNQWLAQGSPKAAPGLPTEPDWPGQPTSPAQPPAQPVSPALRQALGLEAPQPPAPAQGGETDGVAWQLERLQLGDVLGDVPGMRWFSPDFKFEGGFLLLAQKPQGMRIASGLLGGLGRLFGQQALRLYGFSPADTPGLESAAPLDPPEPRLEPHYVSLTSNAFAARQALNPWVIIPLAAWGARSPLQPASPAQDQSQLVVLFSPRGVYVAGVGADTPAEIDALSELGVELVRALGG